MRGIETSLGVALAIGLLAGSAGGAAAQDEEAERLAPASFSWFYWFGPEANSGTDPETGFDIVLAGIEAQDPRAEGRLCYLDMEGGVNFDGSERDEPQQSVSISPVRLVGSGGVWVGTYRGLYTWEPDTRTRKQRKNDRGKRPLRDGSGFYEFVGVGAYEGLSMFLADRNGRPGFGIIVPTETVPAQPEPPPPPDCIPR